MKRWVDSDELPGAESRARELLLQVELPPPNPQARARVWARLEAKRPKPTPLVRIGLVGATLGALLVWFAPWSAEPGLVVVAADADQSLVGVPLAPARPLVVGDADRLQLQGEVAGQVVLFGGATIELLLEAGDALRLERGRLSRRGGGLEWTLESPPYQLIARGDFWVARLGEVITVEVQSGEVELRGPKLQRVLHAGERYESPAVAAATKTGAEAASASQPAGTPEAASASQLAESPQPRTTEPLVGRPPASGLGRAEEPLPNRRRAGAAEVRRPASTPSPAEVNSESATGPDPAGEPGALRRPLEHAAETPEIPRSPAPAATAPAPTDWATLYRRAQQTRSPALAVPLFDQVAASDSPYAEVAGHQAARLVMRQDARLAIPRYQRLLSRFPDGAYAPEGRLNLIECRLITQDLDGASRELEAFLARYPSSERTTELLRMKDNLAARKKP